MSVVVGAFGNDESSRGEYRAPAAEKALDILEFLAGQSEGLTQTEIAIGLGRSLHEIYRILHLLEKRGYLVRTKSDRMRLSLKLFELAHMHPPVNRLVENALPIMRDLSTNCDQSCHLVVLTGTKVLVVLQIDSPLPMRYSVALGSQFPVLETSAGAVLLSCLEPEERDAIIGRILARGNEYGTRAEIDARISAARALGYEMRASLAVEACTNISNPIRDHTGAAIAVLTVPFLPQKAARFDREIVFERAQDAANRISAAIGKADGASSFTQPRNGG